METNLDEIKQGSINYYQKMIINNEIISSQADKEGDWKLYYSSSKEAQNDSFRLMLLDYDETSCALLTNKEGETIPDSRIANIKECKTLSVKSFTYFSKLNTIRKNNPEIFNAYNNNTFTISFENGYDFLMSFNNFNQTQFVSTNKSLQKLFGLNGLTQPIRNNPLLNIQRYDFNDQKLVGFLDLSIINGLGLQLYIDNDLGNLSEIITKENMSFVYFYLKNIQINSLGFNFIGDISNTIIFNVENAPNLIDVRSFGDETQYVISFIFINCPLFNFSGFQNFLGDIEIVNCPSLPNMNGRETSRIYNLIVKDCDIIDYVFVSLTRFQSAFGEDGSIDIDNCPLLNRLELKADVNTSIEFISIKNTALKYDDSGTSRLFFNFTNFTNAPNINLSNNSFTEAMVDQILIDINNSTWVGSSTINGQDKSISLLGNNAPPSQNVIDNIIPALQSSGWTIQYNI